MTTYIEGGGWGYIPPSVCDNAIASLTFLVDTTTTTEETETNNAVVIAAVGVAVLEVEASAAGTRNIRNKNRNNNIRLFDNVNFDDLPGLLTQRISNIGATYWGVGSSSDGPCSDPYNRGLSSDFVNTNGSRPTKEYA